jgi:MFS family permease
VNGLWGAFTVFMNPLQEEFNLERATISLVASLGLIIYGVLSPISGNLVDRYGPRIVILVSSILMGVSVTSLYFVSNYWHFLLLHGIPVAFGWAGAGIVATTSLVKSWFKEDSQLPLSIMQSGLPFGTIIITPAASYLIQNYGWRSTYLILGLIILLTIPTLTLLLIPKNQDETKNKILRAGPEKRVSKQILTSPFLILSAVYLICGFTDIPIINHMAPYLLDLGYKELYAGYILGVIGIVTWIGTLLFGFFSKAIKRKLLISTIYLTRALGFILLIKGGDTNALLIFTIIFGLTQFSMVPLIAGWIGDYYGTLLMGRLFGITTLIHAIGAASGTYINGLIHDTYATYTPAFTIASILALLASSLYLLIPEKGAKVKAS